MMFGAGFEFGDPRERETVGQRKQRKAAQREGSFLTDGSGERPATPPAVAKSKQLKTSKEPQPVAQTAPTTGTKPKSRFGIFGSKSKETSHEKKPSLSSNDITSLEPKISLVTLDTSAIQRNVTSGNNGHQQQPPTPPLSENDISRRPPLPPPNFPVPPTPEGFPNDPHSRALPTLGPRVISDSSYRPVLPIPPEDTLSQSPRTTRSFTSGRTGSEASLPSINKTLSPFPSNSRKRQDGEQVSISPSHILGSTQEEETMVQSFGTYSINDDETNFKFRRNTRTIEPKFQAIAINTRMRSGNREGLSQSPNSAILPPYDTISVSTVDDLGSKMTLVRGPSRTGGEIKQPVPVTTGRSSFQQAIMKMENAGLKIMFKRLSEDWSSGGQDTDVSMLEEVAFEQRLWALVAAEWLTFGKSLQSGAHELMSEARPEHGRRLLHLHGSAADGWVLAAKYPNVTVYSVSSQDISNPPCVWPAPLNHHPLFLPQPSSSLPFPDNYFDVISTKSFPAILRRTDWIPILNECSRVLKPGGWIELQIIDPILTKQGDLLRDWLDTRIIREMVEDNYATKPSDDVLGYLQETGFEDVKRSRIALPASFNPKTASRGGPDPDAARVMVLVGRHFYEELYRGFLPIVNGSSGDSMWWNSKSIKHECESLHTCFGLTFAFGQKLM